MQKRYLTACMLMLICMTLLFACSKSGRRQALLQEKQNNSLNDVRMKTPSQGSKSVVAMISRDGVYQIPIEVNGFQLYFILDTGASSIAISSAEATVLVKQGKLHREDFLGNKEYMTADGSIIPGVVINFATVRIGSRTLYNVEASVTANANAPLLLGQSALQQFGKISIDYTRNEITFEDK